MKRTLPVYYLPHPTDARHSRGELIFNTLSVEAHAALEGQKPRLMTALQAATKAFRASMELDEKSD